MGASLDTGAHAPLAAAGSGRVWLRGFTAAMVLLVLASAGALLWASRQQELALAGETSRHRAARLADEVGRTLDLARLAFAQTESDLQRLPAGASLEGLTTLGGAVERGELLAALPLPLSLHAVDATGRTVALTPTRVGLPDQPSPPWKGLRPPTTGGGWQLELPVGPAGARRLPAWRAAPANPHGITAFVAWIDHAALVARLETDLLGPDGSVALVRLEADGSHTVLARAPHRDDALGHAVRGPLAAAVASAPAGQFDTSATLDGVQRRIAYQRLSGDAGALAVLQGAAHDTVLTRWRGSMALGLGLAAVLVLGIGHVGWRLDRLLGALARQQAALARSEGQFRALTDNLPDPVVRFDAAGRHLYANPAVLTATGVPPEAFIGRTNAEMGMPPENVAVWQATLARAFDTGEPQRLEFAFPGPKGPRQWESMVLREPGRPDEPPTVLVISRDITERHRAAEALADSERRLREAQRIAALGHWELDIATLQMTWSDLHYELFGLDRASFQPSLPAIEAMTHPEDRPLVRGTLERSMAERGRISLVHRVLLPDGRLRHMQVEGEAVFGPEGQPLRCIGTVQDITERQEADNQIRRLAGELEQRVQERTAQLAQSEARYRTIFDTVPVAIGEEDWSAVLVRLRALRAQGVTEGPAYFAANPGFVRDCLQDVRINRVNRAAQSMMARHRPLSGAEDRQGLARYYADDATLPLFADQLGALWRGDRHYSDKRTAPSREGPPMKIMLTVALPSLDDADGIALACLVDIGELDRLNAELDSSVARLRQVNQELETFTYSVSHDLKAPLRGIDGYSRLLLTDHRDQLNEEGQTFLDRIRQATQHMGALIDDLLAYSRLERRELQLGRLPLAPLVQRVLAGFASECRDRGVALTVDVADALAVRADDQGLTIALRNLVDNALKFTRDRQPPSLKVRAHRSGVGVALVLEDNGVGFDMKYHDRIFAIFQRLHRAEDYPGTGIGLAIVRKAVERMGGQVRAHGAAGQGASFTIELPDADRPVAH